MEGAGGAYPIRAQPAHRVLRSPILLTDKKERIFSVLIGRPADALDWGAVVDQMTSEFIRESSNPALWDHQRGKYAVINTGVSYGGGQRVSTLCFFLGEGGLRCSCL